jgi:molybdopterin-binding protein
LRLCVTPASLREALRAGSLREIFLFTRRTSGSSSLPIFSIATDSRQGHGLGMSQSIRNRIQGTINEITSDKVLTEVVLNTAIGPIAAVITTRSVNELGLKVGDSVYALVKATNVSVEKA